MNGRAIFDILIILVNVNSIRDADKWELEIFSLAVSDWSWLEGYHSVKLFFRGGGHVFRFRVQVRVVFVDELLVLFRGRVR